MFFIRPPPSGDSSFYIGTCPGLKERPPGERPVLTGRSSGRSPFGHWPLTVVFSHKQRMNLQKWKLHHHALPCSVGMKEFCPENVRRYLRLNGGRSLGFSSTRA